MRRAWCAALVLGVLGCGGQVEQEEATWEVTPPLALLDVREVSFSPTRVGSVDSAVVRVTNAGDAPLIVESAEIEGGDGAFEVSPARWIGVVELPGGEGRIVAVTYAPRARGIDEATLVLRTNAVDSPELRVPIRGEGTTPLPRVEAPSTVELEPTRALESSETVFSIRNTGEAELLLDGPVVEAIQPGDLLIRYPDPEAPEDSSRDTVVASPGLDPGDTLLVRAVFAPERPGTFPFTLRWGTNDPAREELVIELTGQAEEAAPPEPATCPVAIALVSLVEGEDGVLAPSLDVPESSVIELYGLTSFSPLAVEIERFEWEILERPAGSTVLLMPNPRSPTPRMFMDAPGRYVFGLSVFDAFGRESCERGEVEVFSVATP